MKEEHHSTERKPAVAARRVFTVADDHALLQAYKKLKSKKDFSFERLAEEAGKKLPDWGLEALRERASTYFVGLSKADEDKIARAHAVVAGEQKSPQCFVHFRAASKGDKQFFTVAEISEHMPDLPPLVIKTSRPASQQHSPARKSRSASRESKSAAKQASASPKKPRASRGVEAKIEETDLPQADASLGKRDAAHGAQQEVLEESALGRKLSAFLERLRSDDRKAVEENAKLLAKLVQHFACNFSVEVQEIMKLMEAQAGDIDVNKLRAHFVRGL